MIGQGKIAAMAFLVGVVIGWVAAFVAVWGWTC